MKETRQYIYKQIKDRQLSVEQSKVILKEIKQAGAKAKDIAVIGMAGRFPQADNLDEFWRNLRDDIDCITDFPESRQPGAEDFIRKSAPVARGEVSYAKGGYLNNIADFDAGYFRISHKEAELMDPVQRLLLSTVMEAAEDAGYGGKRLTSTRTGIFIGRDHTVGNTYTHLIDNSDELALTGSYTGILASRISYFLDLNGPSVVVDSACSAGLVAIHNAVQSLRNQECSMAVAGGVCLIFCPVKNPAFDLVESGLNIVKPFDKDADGTMWGEGIGALLLKPLDKAIADGDPIHAIIKGSAVNNDGKSNGITAPNAAAQEDVFTRAWADAGISPQTISYIETHGTGTKLGDPIEVSALTNAFKRTTSMKQFCGIGSVKSNIGHLAAASGIASIMKVILSMKHQQLLSSLHFDNPNPFIEFARSPVYMVDKKQDWISNAEHPRRAGVSAFGFSGTNCHIVLEEATEPAPEQVRNHDSLLPAGSKFIMTVSAMDQDAVYKLVEQQHRLLSRNRAADLANICYSSAIGRGHYNCRLAIITDSKEDLLEKLSRIGRDRLLRTTDQEGIYYNEFRIVPDSKKDKAPGELVERERQQLSEQFRSLASNNADTSGHFLAELCQVYVKGADADWKLYYQDTSCKSVTLPVYPFKKDICWPKAPAVSVNSAHSGLPGEKVLRTYKQDIYEMKLRASEQWFIHEHIMMGLPIVPAAALLEWARATGEKQYGHSRLHLSDVRFSSPLIVHEAQGAIAHTLVEHAEDHIQFNLVSRAGDEPQPDGEEWLLNAEGSIRPLDGHDYKEKPRLEIKDLLEENKGSRVAVDFSGIAGRTQFGQRWHNITQLTKGEDFILLQVSLNHSYLADFDQYVYHPALLDTALNAVAMFILEEPYLPLSIKNLKMYDKMPQSFYSLLRRKMNSAEHQETVSYDIRLADEQGNVFAEADNYTLKRVQPALLGQSLLYRIQWTRADRTATAVYPAPSGDGSIVLFGVEHEQISQLASLLEAAGNDLIRVEHGEHFQRLAAAHYMLGDDPADYELLFADLKHRPVSRLIHGFSLQESEHPGGLSGLATVKSLRTRSLFHLVQALSQADHKQQMEIILLTANAAAITALEAIREPMNTALVNLGKVINTEYPNLNCRALDMDAGTNLESILDDLLGTREAYFTAYRNNERYIEQLVARSAADTTEPLALHRNGVYMITGGTGGIGLEMAKQLASRERITLALLSRSGCPPRQEWERIRTAGTDHKSIRLIEYLEQIERSGSVVEVLACDITQEEELRSAMRQLRKRFGPVRGIVHSAGIAGNGYLFHKSWQEFEKVTGPKIEGTYLLFRLLEEQPDFFISFSSAATLEGSPGQSDYLTGNGYLDGFSSYLNSQGIRGLTLNWSAWAETGMALEHGALRNEGLFRPLHTDEAIAAFEQAMASGGSQWYIGAVNKQASPEVADRLYVQLGQDWLPARAPGISGTSGTSGASGNSGSGYTPAEHAFQLTGRPDGHYDDVELRVARIWAETLHMATVNIYDSFLDLGGDSLIATQLIKKLDVEFPGVLDLPDLFSYPSVFQLTEYIHSKQPEASSLTDWRDIAAALETSGAQVVEVSGKTAESQQVEGSTQDSEQDSGDLLKQKLLAVLDQVTSGDQSVKDAVNLLSQRRKTTDD